MPSKKPHGNRPYELDVLNDAVFGEVVEFQVTPYPEFGLWVRFCFYGENGGASVGWAEVDSNGQASAQIVVSPSYMGGPGTGYAYVGDGKDVENALSEVEIFPIAG